MTRLFGRGRRNLKHRAIDVMLAQHKAVVAEEIAVAIERSVCEPGDQCAARPCPDCTRYRQALADAATARRIGGAS